MADISDMLHCASAPIVRDKSEDELREFIAEEDAFVEAMTGNPTKH